MKQNGHPTTLKENMLLQFVQSTDFGESDLEQKYENILLALEGGS